MSSIQLGHISIHGWHIKLYLTYALYLFGVAIKTCHCKLQLTLDPMSMSHASGTAQELLATFTIIIYHSLNFIIWLYLFFLLRIYLFTFYLLIYLLIYLINLFIYLLTSYLLITYLHIYVCWPYFVKCLQCCYCCHVDYCKYVVGGGL